MKIAALWITDKVNFEILDVQKEKNYITWKDKFLGRTSLTEYELGITLRPDEDSVNEYIVFDYPENKEKMKKSLMKELNFEADYLEEELTSLKNKIKLLEGNK